MNKQEVIKTIYGHLSETEDECSKGTFYQGYDQGCEFCIALIEQLDEPKKVIVPQVVADWIKYAKQQGYGFMQSYDPKEMFYPINDGLDKWIDDNEETFAHAWLVGYEVEKKQLYYVDFIKNDDVRKRLVFDHENGKYNIVDWSDNLIGLVQEIFTEQEIKAIDERYWPFAVKVDGGE